jgi:RNA polymerase sigma-70 factor (ECF subfamily)
LTIISERYALAQCILRDLDRTDDAVQDCLVSAWRKLPRLRDVDRFDAWLRRLLVNACYDESRRERRRSAEIRSIPLDRAGGRDSSADFADRDELERGFRRLSVEQRAVLVMTHYLGMSATEVAETLDIPVGTVSHGFGTRSAPCGPALKRMSVLSSSHRGAGDDADTGL